MSIIESLTLAFERDVEQIEAELGDDHLIRILQCLMSNSSEADQRLIELHLQCQNVISKYPPLKSYNEELKQRTKSQRSSNHNDEESTRARLRKLQSEVRVMIRHSRSLISSRRTHIRGFRQKHRRILSLENVQQIDTHHFIHGIFQ